MTKEQIDSFYQANRDNADIRNWRICPFLLQSHFGCTFDQSLKFYGVFQKWLYWKDLGVEKTETQPHFGDTP